MNEFEDTIEDQDRPPPWFSNTEDATSEPPSTSGPSRGLVTVMAALVVGVLLLIPVLQSALLERRNNDLPDDAVERVAVQFASAVLFARSTGQALLLASSAARDDIEDVVAYFDSGRIDFWAIENPGRSRALSE